MERLYQKSKLRLLSHNVRAGSSSSVVIQHPLPILHQTRLCLEPLRKPSNQEISGTGRTENISIEDLDVIRCLARDSKATPVGLPLS